MKEMFEEIYIDMFLCFTQHDQWKISIKNLLINWIRSLEIMSNTEKNHVYIANGWF